MKKRDNIIREIKVLIRHLNENAIPIMAAILFGSAAKGEMHAYSDIDLALVSDKFSGSRFKDLELLIPYLRHFNPMIEIHPIRPEDYNEDDLFTNAIMKDSISLC